MISDKKQIWVIFLSKFNMGHKAAEATCNINSAFGRGTANECTVQWWVKKFCKGDESLEDEQCSGQAWEVDSDQFGTIIKSDPLTTADVAEELSLWLKSLSRVRLFVTPWIAQHARPPCPSPTPGVYPNPCPSSRWCHPAISSLVVPFSSCPQLLQASGSFPVSLRRTQRRPFYGCSAFIAKWKCERAW